jgi:O-antigen/teichoic acid export membrane protein
VWLGYVDVSKVKLRLSGGLAFAANILSYLTGFIFSILITRRLTEEEFGVWVLIGSL